MKLVIAAIGRLKDDAEQVLVERYSERLGQAGKRLGLAAPRVIELPESRQADASRRVADEAARLRSATSSCEAIVALDEGGKALASRAFADHIKLRRDQGCGSIAFLIGGPDGHGPEIRANADLLLSLGPMTWPHGLARVLLLEQLYRTATILAGHPYHRG